MVDYLKDLAEQVRVRNCWSVERGWKIASIFVAMLCLKLWLLGVVLGNRTLSANGPLRVPMDLMRVAP